MENNQDPYATPSSSVDNYFADKEVPFFKSWIIFFLMASVGGFFVGAVVGGGIGAVMGSSGAPMQTIQVTSAVAGFVLSLPISYFSFKWSVRKYILCHAIEAQ